MTEGIGTGFLSKGVSNHKAVRKCGGSIKRIGAFLIALMLMAGQNGISVMAASKHEPVSQRTKEQKEESMYPSFVKGTDVISDEYVSRVYADEDMNSLVYQKADGTKTLYSYEDEIKYIDEEGVVRDKSTEIVVSTDDEFAFSNSDNDFELKFPENPEDGVIVEKNESNIVMTPVDISDDINCTSKDNKVTYEECYGEGTALEYQPLLNGIKETIILEENNYKYDYEFELTLNGSHIIQLDDNNLYVEDDKSGKIMGIIEAPFIEDSNGKTTYNCSMSYEEINNGIWLLTVHVDRDFLESPLTAYPVSIDPTYEFSSETSHAIYDSTIYTGIPSSQNGKSGSLFIGNRGGSYGVARVVMRIPIMALLKQRGLKSSIEVQSAEVTLRDLMCESTSLNIVCEQPAALGAWTEDNICWNTQSYYMSAGTYDVRTVSYANGIQQSPTHRYSFDITVAVKNWINCNAGFYPYYNLYFRAEDESKVNYKTFASMNRASNQPTFKITYVSNTAAFSFSYLDSLRNIGESSGLNPNCFGFALGRTSYIAPIGGTTSYSNFAISVINRCANMGINVRVASSDWRKVKLNYNEYLMAGRTGGDFHFMVQTKDGKWAEKHGGGDGENRGYIDPLYSVYWEAQYTSPTVFFIVTRNV